MAQRRITCGTIATIPRCASKYALCFGKRPAEELYDLRNDPGEIVNVADDPRYARQKQHLARRLNDELAPARTHAALAAARSSTRIRILVKAAANGTGPETASVHR